MWEKVDIDYNGRRQDDDDELSDDAEDVGALNEDETDAEETDDALSN